MMRLTIWPCSNSNHQYPMTLTTSWPLGIALHIFANGMGSLAAIGTKESQGDVPSLGNLQNLSVMNLHTNNLGNNSTKDWEFLESLMNCSLLNTIDISVNNFGGPLPENIGVFSNANAISINGNKKLCGGISDLQLPPCPAKVLKQSKHHHFKVIMAISSVVAFLLLLSSIFAIYHVRKNKKSSLDPPTIDQLSKVSYQSLHNATDGFSVRNLIGSGSFADVYRGI
ncbi:putative LRR receptor-like serine/threonine-protein kinase [Senna tora]|uniref:Putative LRR receptor-like serine/threonine-protein kinase n=1 Tax=Senna tora TaxID=362788 RepID=A0A834WJI7_9FABA|nr:putative LRR receptor-like serine/threonine-protein kinase [Senna tora]